MSMGVSRSPSSRAASRMTLSAGKMNWSPPVATVGDGPRRGANLVVVWPRRGRRASAEAEALAVLAGLAVGVESCAAAVAALVGLDGRDVRRPVVWVHQAAAVSL